MLNLNHKMKTLKKVLQEFVNFGAPKEILKNGNAAR